MPPAIPLIVEDASSLPPWRAALDLRFAARDGLTSLASARHEGPLRLQRTLGERDGSCQALILHPPGGVAGGDSLRIDIDIARGAQVLASTPGAAKWYRSNGRGAAQAVRLRVAEGGALDWLPQESVLFREADATQSLQIEMTTGAHHIGWDIVQLGRLAAGEAWDRGRFRQQLELRRDGVLAWRELADFDATDAVMNDPVGLAGHRVFGSLWALAPGLSCSAERALDAVRAVLADIGADSLLPATPDREQSLCCAAATWLAAPAEVLIVRALGNDAEAMRAVFEAAWLALRRCLGRPAQRPRIWST